ERIEQVPARDELDGVRDDLAAHQGGLHALRAHGDAVGDGDAVELDGRAAGGPDPLLHLLGQGAMVPVAGRDLDPAMGHTHERLGQIGVGEADGLEIGARGRAVGTVDEGTALGARVGRHSGFSLWGRHVTTLPFAAEKTDASTLARPRSSVQSAPNETGTVKALTRSAAVLALCAALPALAQDTPLYRDRTRPVDERVRDLLARMTLEEKVAQTLGIWKGKEKITDAAGQFDPAGARALIANGLGQLARPTELRDKPTKILNGPRENAVFVN